MEKCYGYSFESEIFFGLSVNLCFWHNFGASIIKYCVKNIRLQRVHKSLMVRESHYISLVLGLWNQ